MNKVRLGDVAIQIRGVSYKPEDILSENDDNSIGILRANNIQEELELSDIVYIRQDRVKDYQLLKKDDILICASSGSKNLVGKAVRIPCDLNLSFGAFCKVVRTKGTINSDYLSTFFQSDYYRRYISNISEGANINNIKNKHIDNLLINYPNESNQLLISQKLLALFSVIKAKKKQIVKLDELVKSRFVEMFGDPMENDMEWDMAILDTICDGIGDGLHGTPEYEDNSGYPFINGNNLIDGKITITSTTKFVSCSTYEKHRIDFTDNCILLSINGTLGKVAYYHNEKIMLGKSACYINLKSCVNKTFVFELMRTPFFLRFLDDNSTKSTIKNVGLKAIRGFKLILPPIDVQNQFADFVTKIEQQKATVQKSIDKLETLKKSLMQEYFG